MGESLIYDLRTEVFSHVQRQPIAFFTRTQTGSLVSRLNSDVIGAQQAITSTSVSYTHLDVYKRQVLHRCRQGALDRASIGPAACRSGGVVIRDDLHLGVLAMVAARGELQAAPAGGRRGPAPAGNSYDGS